MSVKIARSVPPVMLGILSVAVSVSLRIARACRRFVANVLEASVSNAQMGPMLTPMAPVLRGHRFCARLLLAHTSQTAKLACTTAHRMPLSKLICGLTRRLQCVCLNEQARINNTSISLS